jgi:cell division protease FtsH
MSCPCIPNQKHVHYLIPHCLLCFLAGKVERVRFSKDGTMLQLTAIDGRRATVVLPNDPDLVDILARNGVDISVSEGDQQGEA